MSNLDYETTRSLSSPLSSPVDMSPSTIHDSKRVFKIASIPGDGIGSEISSAAVEVLQKLAFIEGSFQFEFNHFDWSSENYVKRGWYMPEDGMDQLRKNDAIYFGAVGWPSTSLLVSVTDIR